MAGSVYRAGAAAASELKDQYSNTRIRGGEWSNAQVSIPGAFPQVSIVHKGEEQMVLFPTYAKRHVRKFGGVGRFPPGHSLQAANAAQSEEDYWKQEWSRREDEKAVVDVDIRGWIYMPSKGPMTRRNRMLIGLARRLSGISPPTTQSEPTATTHEEHERMREERRIAREAQEIERRGQQEKEVANKGEYSEFPSGSDGSSRIPVSPPPSPTLSARTPTAGQQSELTEGELAVANANLMARLGPFMTTPLVQLPITLFFYNDEQSRSHTVLTDDSGHFITRVALEFVPTHVRVLANEDISATKPVEIIESRGVSLISDIDDTIKRSNIWMGAREIFRNTFVRDLADLTVDGVREWYTKMHDMGVNVHYCSNSPWQLFPVLATFLHTVGLPQGSIHLKHYSGMLQGIFEPVAERKKGTLEAILRDFPERKFLLIGDSGEADLEVYTELAVANPGSILAVFIRDVTTPDQAGFFDSSFSLSSEQRSRQGITRTSPKDRSIGDGSENRPQLPPRTIIAPPPLSSRGPIMGTLIDFSDEPAQASPEGNRDGPKPGLPLSDNLARKAPPPRPAKPPALRSTPSDASTVSQRSTPAGPDSIPGPPRRTQTSGSTSLSTLSVSPKPTPPPPPPPRRRGTHPASLQQRDSTNSNTDLPETDAFPSPALPRRYTNTQPGSQAGIAPETATPPNGTTAAAAINKKVDLWLRRLARAHETLDAQGVKLYTWRRGEDVIAEAEGIVKEALREVESESRRSGRV
jgi:phosphatidate phosphatase APP1